MTLNPDGPQDPLAFLDDYDFDLPEQLIAQDAIAQRDEARLLLIEREDGAVLRADEDTRVRDLPAWLAPGDLLIVNATRVLPARLVGKKASGGAAGALLLGRDLAAGPETNDYRALLKCTGRIRVGLEFRFGPEPGAAARVEEILPRGEVRLRFENGVDPYAGGEAPLPPYIRRSDAADAQAEADLSRYQTIYAREPGAVAAPTAGLHFTPELFDALAERGVNRAEVILHVGAGTFRPLDAEAVESGLLHEERFELPEETVVAIERTRAAGGRVIAVGTTTTRVLESCAAADGDLRAQSGTTRLFMRPEGPPFRVVDGLLTNFHLPRSSLLMLVAAFVGREEMLAAYHYAIGEGFRFYSYGDAMLILPNAEERAGRGATVEARGEVTPKKGTK